MSTTDKKDKQFNKNSYRGMTHEQLEKLTTEQTVELFRARIRRRFSRGTTISHLGIKNKYNRLLMKCRKSKKNVQPGEKPALVKTHLRDAVVMPEMIGNMVGVYNGKAFTPVEIKFDMIGRYLGEFAITYKPTRHGRPGVGATKGSQHTDKK